MQAPEFMPNQGASPERRLARSRAVRWAGAL